MKISVPPGEVCAIAAELSRCAAEGEEINVVAQATGLITARLTSVAGSAESLIARLRQRISVSGGSLVVLHAPDALRERLDVWGPAPAALPLMREIKRRFDPESTLNPGRFVGNI